MRLLGWILPALVMFSAVGCTSHGNVPNPPGLNWGAPWGGSTPPKAPAVAHAPTGQVHGSYTGSWPVAADGDWGVNNPRHWKYIVIHHSATNNGNAATIDAAHKARGWKGLGYDFVINNGTGKGDGVVEVGFRWRQQMEGAHCGGTPGNEYNEAGIGICLVGDFTDHMPSRSQLASLNRLVCYLMDTYHISASNVIGHREAPNAHTECPGDTFYNYIRRDFRPSLSRR